MANKDGIELSKLLATLRHSTGDIAIQCDADKTISLLTNGVVRAQFGSANLGAASFPLGLKTKQAVTDVNNTTPTAAELTTALGAPATLGRGFVGTVDDADGDTNGFIVWCSDASFYFVKGTKAV